MGKNKTISEFGHIGYGQSYIANKNFISQQIGRNQFKELEDFHKNNKDIFEYVNSHTLQAKGNYVGVIQTPSLTLEILPKIYNGSSKNDEIDIFRQIFLKMLLKIDDIPTAKDGTNANVDVANMNIFEIFIKLFIEHVEELIRKGIKSAYIITEDNLTFLKGKLQFSNHIRYNAAHKERFYVEYDEYMEDRVENRVLKTCINFLLHKSQNFENQKRLRQQLFFFDNVSYSTNIQHDLSCITHLGRGMEQYDMPIKFAKIFLDNKSFAPVKGDNSSFSMLFQMNIVFERFVAKLLEENEAAQNLRTNMKYSYPLLEGESKNKIFLEPDYKFNIGNKLIIGDAKWKLIDKEDNDKFNPNDIYQIYSYLHYFNSDIGYIFTPKVKQNNKKYSFLQSDNKYNEKKLYIYYIDLENINKLTLNLLGKENTDIKLSNKIL